MNTSLTSDYWDARYQGDNTPWDIGEVSPPLKSYLDQSVTKHTRILIPGAGKAHEAIYLHQAGYQQVYVCDWAASSFDYLRKQAPDFPEEHLLVRDFFAMEAELDLILEQTFFCAIDPSLRPAYAQQVASLLSEGGKLVGVFWNHEFPGGPPFGGSLLEYRQLFEPYFDFLQDDISSLSIPPRRGRELFLELQKK